MDGYVRFVLENAFECLMKLDRYFEFLRFDENMDFEVDEKFLDDMLLVGLLNGLKHEPSNGFRLKLEQNLVSMMISKDLE